MKSKKGSVLIVVLVVTALLLGLALQLFETSDIAYVGVAKIHSENQGAVYAATAFEAIASFMETDNADYDAPDELWTLIPPIVIDGGYVSVIIKPADDRLPVNMLGNSDDNISRRAREAFRHLFAEQGFDDEIWETMSDLVSKEDLTPLTTNVKGVTHNTSSNSYKITQGPIKTLAEIRNIPILRRNYSNISKYICAGDVSGKININFASESVIKAFLPELSSYAAEIIEAREDEPFKAKDDVYKLLGTGARDNYIAALPYFDVKSTLFYVHIKIDHIEFIQHYHALFKRDGRKMTLTNYIEGSSLNYY